MGNAANQRKEAVHSAARILDRETPGWHKKMQPEKLVMDDASLCALGQLFGPEIELSIARELFPKEWKALRVDKNGENLHGFDIGLKWFKQRRDENKITTEELEFMHRACSWTSDLKCYWAEEVADRLAADEVKAEESSCPTT